MCGRKSDKSLNVMFCDAFSVSPGVYAGTLKCIDSCLSSTGPENVDFGLL